MKPAKITIVAAILLYGFVCLGYGQDGGDRMFVSNQLNSDPAQMVPAATITMNDPLYVVIDLSRTKGTIGDLVSTNPETGERNLFICMDMNTASMKYACRGILKQPIAESVLRSKSYVYTVMPATNDLNFENIEVTKALLDGLSYAMDDEIELKIAYKNMESKNYVEIRPVIDLRNRTTSRWTALSTAIEAENAAIKRKQQLADTAPLPSSQLKDPVVEGDLFQLAQGAYASSHRLYKVALLDNDWTYYRNEFGVLTGRGRRVALMMKRISNGDCEIHYTRYITQDHIAGGQFSKIRLKWRDNDADWKPVSCSKFVGFK